MADISDSAGSSHKRDGSPSKSSGLSSNSNKRKAPEPGAEAYCPEVTDESPAELPRDVLLRMTSTTLEQYFKELMAKREMTKEELKAIASQRRLIKNRESAQLSRQRKKSYVEELKGELDGLQDEHSMLQAERDRALATLSQLREQLDAKRKSRS